MGSAGLPPAGTLGRPVGSRSHTSCWLKADGGWLTASLPPLGAGHGALVVAFLEVLPLVVELLAAGEPDEHLH
jgi:hypothetical protein